MRRITVLKDAVINQIAAGEVVDRPVSVVRELVDNAIDAGATEIQIAIEDGGRTLIRVSDNGSGMGKEDALLAFERHATSKIVSLADLNEIRTMGFRGEALASIAAVSRVVMRTSEGMLGVSLEFVAGVLKGIQTTPRVRGTDIEVRNLFFSVPARRKFLKSPETEAARIRDWFGRYVLVHPTVGFTLSLDEKIVFSCEPSDFISRARSLYGDEPHEVSYRLDDIAVAGLIGHPSRASRALEGLALAVNGRLVSDKLMLRAVREGFQSMLKSSEFPVGVVSVSLPQFLVDINVHPQKSEVRFAAPSKIFGAVKTAVWDAVRGMTSPLAASAVSAPSYAAVSDPSPLQAPLEWAPSRSLPLPLEGSRVAPNDVPNRLSEQLQSFRYADLLFLGQLFECYLLCEHGGDFVVVDMHAAHERINFNRIRESFAAKNPDAQRLLVPEVIHLTHEQRTELFSGKETLESLGFSWEEGAEGEIAIDSIPSCFVGHPVRDILLELARGGWKEEVVGGKIDAIAARLACHASVRSGKRLTRDEVYSLFKQMDEAELAAACPHGRPCVVTFTEKEIESWFGRDR